MLLKSNEHNYILSLILEDKRKTEELLKSGQASPAICKKIEEDLKIIRNIVLNFKLDSTINFKAKENLLNEEYIILEIIPTAIHPSKGDIIQLSALKIKGIQLQGRFDERLNERLIAIEDFKDLISYDKDSFTYKESTKEILEDFSKWIGDLPLLIIDNAYTENYLESIPNKKESIFNYLDTKYNDNVIEELIEKYNIEPTNYIVDILYESLIKHL